MNHLLQLNPEAARRMYAGPRFHRPPTKEQLEAAKLLRNRIQSSGAQLPGLAQQQQAIYASSPYHHHL